MLHVLSVLSRWLLPPGSGRLKVHNQQAPINVDEAHSHNQLPDVLVCKIVRQKACDSENPILDVVLSSALFAAYLLTWYSHHQTLL